jgi:WD40 repeat protein
MKSVIRSTWLPISIILSVCHLSLAAESPASANDYSAVEAILTKHCLDCHAAQDPDAKLVMESFETLLKGGETGAVIVPGKSSESLLVQMIEGNLVRDGKKLIMPPGKRKKLEAAEVATIKAWIDAGAKGPPAGQTIARQLSVPKIIPKVPPRRSIKALAYASSPKLIAVARYGEVEILSADSRILVRTLSGHRGSVNALVFSADGQKLFAAAGEPGLFGEVRQWKVSDGTLVQVFEGHRDALYSLALTPDGKKLATGSYDQKIKIWNVETGEEVRTLSGHNGAIFDLAFRPDGKILASASADRTVKLWDVSSGERRDTLSQSLKELYTVAFSPDGKRLLAGGVDNRIRVWQISETAAETTNPLLEARFAHEGAILKIAFSNDGKSLVSSAEDRGVKLWDAVEVKERLLLEAQPDWAPALTFVSGDKMVVAGRLDGTLQFYDASNGKIIPPPKPELARAEPRGIQRGTTIKIKLIGNHLAGLTEVRAQSSKLTGQVIRAGQGNPKEAWATLTAAADLKRGPYEISVVNANGESGKIQLHVDDLPQIFADNAKTASNRFIQSLPISIWGAHGKMGDSEEFPFDVSAGRTLVFDASAKSLGSKSDLLLTLVDSEGKVLASNNGFDGSSDPLLVYSFPAAGRYFVRVNELLLGASPDHFYRLSIGGFPYVTGCFPLSVPASSETDVQLVGYNLPSDSKIKIKAEKAGETDLPLDPEKFRSRRAFKLLVSNQPEFLEVEPNDNREQATKITVPVSMGGRIWAAGRTADEDLFQFEAKAGQTWIIETAAAQRGTPLDTKIEVLQADGKPVQRLVLQAVRNSAVTFRAIDSTSGDCRVENWEEMELNQLLYLQGEVVKLFRAPQGPDSGFVFYSANGKRRTFFDTSATAHANEERCYIVEAHPPGAKLVANGLPVFPVHYANDDDGERKLGSDSKIYFTAPASGAYLIRVTDTRGYHGDRFVYRLVVREPRPDFNLTLNGANPTVGAGSGQAFSVNVDRIDGFDGEIKVEIEKLPPGFSASAPLIIQAGHNEAKGTINAELESPPPAASDATNSVLTATATVNGKLVSKTINNFGRIKLGEKPKLYVALEPEPSVAPSFQTSTNLANPSAVSASGKSEPLEITIAPGQTIPAWLKVKRNGHEDLITFTVDNLPHGVIVDNIGLNGVLIPKDQNERQIFFTAAKWIPETERWCFAVENQAGRQTSRPVLLRVRKPASQLSASTKP